MGERYDAFNERRRDMTRRCEGLEMPWTLSYVTGFVAASALLVRDEISSVSDTARQTLAGLGDVRTFEQHGGNQ